VLPDIALDRAACEAEAILFGGEHVDDLPAPREQALQELRGLVGERTGSGRTRWAKSASMLASSASVLASCPMAFAKSRTWRGFTTATGSPALASVIAASISKPPVASMTTSAGVRATSRGINSARPTSSFVTVQLSPSGSEAMSSVAFDTSMPM
jgi:hypothetical protein